MRRRAILTDRDGTVCEEVGYLCSPESLRLLPGSARALALGTEAGFHTVLVTNQSAVARARLTEERLAEIHDRLRAELAERGARLDGIYYCPHHPDGSDARYRRSCSCRKPGPGMLLRARDEMGIDLRSSYVVGDRLDDVAAGQRVGATTVLVRTGYGTRELERTDVAERPRPDHVAADLLDAVRWILERERAPAEGATPRRAGSSRV